MMQLPIHTKTLTLSPGNPVRMGTGSTIGYVNGDVPYLTIHSDGERFDILKGQCVHIGGDMLAVENIFSRTAQVTVTLNGPINLAAAPEDYNFVTYQTGFEVARVADTFLGAAFMLTEGRALLDVGVNAADVIVLDHAKPEYLAHRPAGFMAEQIGFDVGQINPPSDGAGGVMSNMIMMAGAYSDQMVADWIAASGFSGRKAQIVRSSNFATIEMREGTAVFVKHFVPNRDLRVNAKIIDKGAHRSQGIV